jgi:exopolysaccharide biosynthesis polyprenyl glycosylphosphotransferase
MNRHNRKLRKIVLWLADMIVTMLVYLLAMYIRHPDTQDFFAMPSQKLVLSIIALVSTVLGLLFKLNENFMSRGRFNELKAVIKFSVIMTLCIILFAFMTHVTMTLSRLVMGYFFLLEIVILYLERTVIKRVARRMFSSSAVKRKIILIADEENYEDVCENFNPAFSYDIVGTFMTNQFFTKGKINEDTLNTKTMNITSALVTKEFDDVFIYAPTLPKEQTSQLIEHFANMGVTTHYGINVPSFMGQKATFSDFGINYYAINYSERTFSLGELAAKRFFDILGGIIGCILTGIIFIFLAPAIKLDSPGPVIFSQTRIGKNGKRFKFYKFRSMYVDAEERKKELMAQNKVNGLMFKMDDDPRITKVGKFIRKTSLDEFPQFWNVLKGDMSLVGTRPPTEDEFMKYNEYYRKRLSIKPGITGLWQVSGRSDITDFDEVVKLDIQYIDNWSLSEDLRILLKTIAVVFIHKGAE